MAQKKGQTGNPNGRPKGVPNKVTRELRVSIKNFLEQNFEEVTDIWKTLEAKDKLSFYRDMLKYVVPALQAVEEKEAMPKEDEQESRISKLMREANEKFEKARRNNMEAMEY
jgi:chemotaxis regulatin CheY-phosphate phosphatase CheZ